MVTLYTLGKKAALFCYVLVCAFEKKTAAATEIYEKFATHFAWRDMASTLTIRFLCHCRPYSGLKNT